MNNVKTQNEKGEWVDATPEPYWPNWFERITHDWFGKHWFYQAKFCVICSWPKNL